MRILFLVAAFFWMGNLAAQGSDTMNQKANDMKTEVKKTVDEMKSDAKESMADSSANKTVCSSGEDSRTIEIIYDTPGTSVPCRVDYTKAGQTSTLWSAANKEGYCEEKAKALAEKLTGAGFSCQ